MVLGVIQLSDNVTEQVQKLIKKLETAPKVGSRAEAAKALGKLEGDAKEAIPALTKALKKDKNKRVRGRAALALGRIGDKSSVSDIIEVMTNDPEDEVRARAAWSLGDFEEKGKEAIQPLWKEAKDKRNKERLFYYIISLAKLEGAGGEAIKKLQEMNSAGELERWQIIRYQNLAKELDIQAKVKEASEGIASVKDGAKNVQEEVQSLRKQVDLQPASQAKDDLLNVTALLQKMITEQQRTIERQETTIKGLNDSLQELVKAHQQAIQEPRITAEQFHEFKESEPKEKWIKRNLPALIGALGTVIGGIAGLLGWLSGFLGWV